MIIRRLLAGNRGGEFRQDLFKQPAFAEQIQSARSWSAGLRPGANLSHQRAGSETGAPNFGRRKKFDEFISNPLGAHGNRIPREMWRLEIGVRLRRRS